MRLSGAKSRASLLFALALAVSGVYLAAQEKVDPKELRATVSEYVPRTPFILKAEATLVEVGAVVRDSKGRTVAGLQQSDFEITDEGQPRPITGFSVYTATPASQDIAAGKDEAPQLPTQPRVRHVGLIFDDMNSEFSEFRSAKIAAERFVKEGLSAGDQVAVFTIAKSQVLPFTSEPARIIEAIEDLKVFPFRAQGPFCPEISPLESYLISVLLDMQALEVKVYEANKCLGTPRSFGRGTQSNVQSLTDPTVRMVHSAAYNVWQQVRRNSQSALGTLRNIIDYMAVLPGSRMLLIASSGFISRTLEDEQNELISRALRGGVVINSLDAKGLYTQDATDISKGGDEISAIYQMLMGTRPQEERNNPLVYLANSTGGRFYHNSNDLHQGFKELAALPEITYLLAFRPDAAPDGKFHRLKVRLKAPNGFSVQARLGYYAAKLETVESGTERRIDREVLSNTSIHEFPVTMAARIGGLDSGKTGLATAASVDVRQLKFTERSGRRTQKVTFIAVLLDEQGNFVTGREGVIELDLKQSTYERVAEQGLHAVVQIEALPGRYRLRGVVEEAGEGRIATFNQPVEIR
jgi:VWFA-related protein